jgi:hypothetical protein
MRIVRIAILIALVCSMLTGCDSCIKKNTTADNGGNTHNAATVCNTTTCTHVVHVGASCQAVTATNTALDHLNAQPGDTVCIFSDNTGSITLSFPTGLIASPADPAATDQTFTLAHNQCASFAISESAKNQTFQYHITGDCPPPDGMHGNPDVIVGGGSGP